MLLNQFHLFEKLRIKSRAAGSGDESNSNGNAPAPDQKTDAPGAATAPADEGGVAAAAAAAAAIGSSGQPPDAADRKLSQIEAACTKLLIPSWEVGELVSLVKSKPVMIDQVLLIVKEYKRCIEKMEVFISSKNNAHATIKRLSGSGALGITTDATVLHLIYDEIHKSTKLSLQCLYTYSSIRRLESTPRIYMIADKISLLEYLSHDAKLLYEFIKHIDFDEKQVGFIEFIDELYFLMRLGNNLESHKDKLLKYNGNFLQEKAPLCSIMDRLLLEERNIIECSTKIAAEEEARQGKAQLVRDEENKQRLIVEAEVLKLHTEREKEIKLKRYREDAAKRNASNPYLAPYSYPAVFRLPYKSGSLVPVELDWFRGTNDFYSTVESQLRGLFKQWKTFAFISKAETDAEIKRKLDEEEAEKQRIIEEELAEKKRLADIEAEKKRMQELEEQRIKDEIEAENERIRILEEETRARLKKEADEKRRADREADNRQIYRSRKADLDRRRRDVLGSSTTADYISNRDRGEPRSNENSPDRPRSSPEPVGGDNQMYDYYHQQQQRIFTSDHRTVTGVDKADVLVIDQQIQHNRIRELERELENKRHLAELEAELKKQLEQEFEENKKALEEKERKRVEALAEKIKKDADIEAYNRVKIELDAEFKKKAALEAEVNKKMILAVERKKQIEIDAEKTRAAKLEDELKMHLELEAINKRKKEMESTSRISKALEAENTRKAALLELETRRQVDIEEEAKRKEDIAAGTIFVDLEEEAQRLQAKEEEYREMDELAAEYSKKTDLEIEAENQNLSVSSLSFEDEVKILAEIESLNKRKLEIKEENKRKIEEEAEKSRIAAIETEEKRIAELESITRIKDEIDSLIKVKTEIEATIQLQKEIEEEAARQQKLLDEERRVEQENIAKVNTYIEAARRFSDQQNFLSRQKMNPSYYSPPPKLSQMYLQELPDSIDNRISSRALVTDSETAPGVLLSPEMSKLYKRNKTQSYNSVDSAIIKKSFDYEPQGHPNTFSSAVTYSDPFLNTTLTNLNMRSKTPLKNSMNRLMPRNKMAKVMKQMGKQMSKEEAKKKLIVWWRYIIPRRRLLDRLFKKSLALEILDDIICRVYVKSVQLVKHRILMLRNGAARIIQKFAKDFVKFRVMKRAVLQTAVAQEVAWYLLDRWTNSVLAAIRIWRFLIKWKLKRARNNSVDLKKIKSKDLKKKFPLKNMVDAYFNYMQFVPRVVDFQYLKNIRKKWTKELGITLSKNNKNSGLTNTLVSAKKKQSGSRLFGAYSSSITNQAFAAGNIVGRDLTPVVKIQCMIRIFLAKKKVRLKRTTKYIFIKVLSFMNRGKVRKSLRLRKLKNLKAILIQKNIRGFLGRRLTFRIVKAAFVIIRSWKRYNAMCTLRNRLRRVERPYTIELQSLNNITEEALEGNTNIYVKMSVFWNPLLHIVNGNDFLTVVNLKAPQIVKRSPKFETTGTTIYKPISLSEELEEGEDEEVEEHQVVGAPLEALAVVENRRIEKLKNNLTKMSSMAALLPLPPIGGGGGAAPTASASTSTPSNFFGGFAKGVRKSIINLGSIVSKGGPRRRGGALDHSKPLRICTFSNYSFLVPGCHGKSVLKLEVFRGNPSDFGNEESKLMYTWYLNIGEQGKLLYWGAEYELPLHRKAKYSIMKSKPQGKLGLIRANQNEKKKLSDKSMTALNEAAVINSFVPLLKFKVIASPAMLSKCGWVYCYIGSKQGPLKQQLMKTYTLLLFMDMWKKLYLSMTSDYIVFYDDRYSTEPIAKWACRTINKCDIKAGQSRDLAFGNSKKEDLCNLEVTSRDGDFVVFRYLSASDRVGWIDVFQNLVGINSQYSYHHHRSRKNDQE